jgi:two-component system chemotaxis sensor kinase CheA
MDFSEDIKEFLIESSENLARLDQDFVLLERSPNDTKLISSAFRTIHTIKGTSGFFGFEILGELTHHTESLLSDVREGKRQLGRELISLILEAVDHVRTILAVIELTGQEGEDHTSNLRARLEQAKQDKEYGFEAEDPALTEDPLMFHAPTPTGMNGSANTSRTESVAFKEGQADIPDLDITSVVDCNKVQIKRGSAKVPKSASGDVPQELSTGEHSQFAESTIRVDVVLLNRLMNLVGELVLARNQLLQDAPDHGSALQQTSQRLNLITSELQEGVMKTRMQPIGVVWNKLPRVVRDLAAVCGKKIRLEMDGAGTELDKTIIEAIKDPLTHIVRNCCDHGIETPEVRRGQNKMPEGLVRLRAYHEGGVVNIEISDDGAGIDLGRVKDKALEKGLIRPEEASNMSARDAMHLIFMPGFSTAAQVTSISGRGVGMDVVKNNIEKIGGNVEVLAPSEGGTTIRIKIPLTLAIIPGLVVTLNESTVAGAGEDDISLGKTRRPRWRSEERFIIPQANLVELVRIGAAEQAQRIKDVHGTPVFHHRGKLLPLVYLGRVLGRFDRIDPSHDVSIVVLQAESRKIGLVVDRICDTQEIVVKPLGRHLKSLICYVGATIMGDGRPALILDVVGLARLAGLGAQARPVVPIEPMQASEQGQSQMFLLFSAGSFARVAAPLALVDRLEEIAVSTIEHAAGQPVLHYRNEILPLITLEQLLLPGHRNQSFKAETMHVIVFTIGTQRMGLVVDHILDIVDDVVSIRRGVGAPGLLGSAVINGHITDLLDFDALLAATSANQRIARSVKAAHAQHVLLVDDSLVSRELIRGVIEIAGFTTIHASTSQGALQILRTQAVDLVGTSVHLGTEKGGLDLLASIRADPTLRHIPVIGFEHRQDGTNARTKNDHDEEYDRCLDYTDRQELLSAIATLIERRVELPMEVA